MSYSIHESKHQEVTASSDIPLGGVVEVESYDKFEDVVDLAKQWDAFMELIHAEIFLTFDWCKTWWKYYGEERDLLLLVFRQNSVICGILPLFYEKIRLGPVSLRIIKIVGADHTPVTISVPARYDCIDQIAEQLISLLDRKWKWDLLYIGAICGRYNAVPDLVDALRKHMQSSFHIDSVEQDVQTYFAVAESWEKHIAGLGRKQRTNVKRTYREIEKNKITVSSSLASKENVSIMFGNFIQMHQKYWNKLGMPGHFGAWPHSAAFHRDVADSMLGANRLRLIEIKFNDQPVAYEYVYTLNDTYFWFLNARDEARLSPGIDFKWISYRQKLENAIKDGVHCIDGMRGRYEYKILMGGEAKPVHAITIHSNKTLITFRVTLFRFLVGCINVCYSKLWRARIAPKFKYKPKAFWSKWIRFHMLSKWK